MTASGQNFNMIQGDDKVLRVAVYDENDELLSLSGNQINYVWYRRTPGNIVLTKIVGDGITILDQVTDKGFFTITLDDDDTETFLGLFNHECEITDGVGNISTIFTGIIQVNESKA